MLPAEGWDYGFWWKDCAILDVAAVPDGAPSPDHTVLADVDVRVDHGGVDDAPLADVDMITDLQREESHALAELLEGRPDDGLTGDDAVAPHPHVGEVAADYGLGLDNVFTIEDDVLRTAKNTLSTDSVATSCLYVFSLIERDVWKLHFSEMCNSMYRILLLQVNDLIALNFIQQAVLNESQNSFTIKQIYNLMPYYYIQNCKNL